MSDLILKKSMFHQVTHDYSGKMHFYNVISPSGNKYSVSVKINCECEFFGKQGNANGDICSHIMSVFRAIVRKGNMQLKEEE